MPDPDLTERDPSLHTSADDRPVVDSDEPTDAPDDDLEVDLEANPADTVEQSLAVAIDDDEYR